MDSNDDRLLEELRRMRPVDAVVPKEGSPTYNRILEEAMSMSTTVSTEHEESEESRVRESRLKGWNGKPGNRRGVFVGAIAASILVAVGAVATINSWDSSVETSDVAASDESAGEVSADDATDVEPFDDVPPEPDVVETSYLADEKPGEWRVREGITVPALESPGVENVTLGSSYTRSDGPLPSTGRRAIANDVEWKEFLGIGDRPFWLAADDVEPFDDVPPEPDVVETTFLPDETPGAWRVHEGITVPGLESPGVENATPGRSYTYRDGPMSSTGRRAMAAGVEWKEILGFDEKPVWLAAADIGEFSDVPPEPDVVETTYLADEEPGEWVVREGITAIALESPGVTNVTLGIGYTRSDGPIPSTGRRAMAAGVEWKEFLGIGDRPFWLAAADVLPFDG